MTATPPGSASAGLHCRTPTYRIPRYGKFVDGFPMTVTGKIQKFKMRETAVEELGLTAAAGVQTA